MVLMSADDSCDICYSSREEVIVLKRMLERRFNRTGVLTVNEVREAFDLDILGRIGDRIGWTKKEDPVFALRPFIFNDGEWCSIDASCAPHKLYL